MVRWHGKGPIAGCAVLIAALLVANVAQAGERAPSDRGPTAERVLDEFYRLMDRLEGMLEEIPRYAPPEIDENGDIIIRRLPRHPERLPPVPHQPDDMVDL